MSQLLMHASALNYIDKYTTRMHIANLKKKSTPPFHAVNCYKNSSFNIRAYGFNLVLYLGRAAI